MSLVVGCPSPMRIPGRRTVRAWDSSPTGSEICVQSTLLITHPELGQMISLAEPVWFRAEDPPRNLWFLNQHIPPQLLPFHNTRRVLPILLLLMIRIQIIPDPDKLLVAIGCGDDDDCDAEDLVGLDGREEVVGGSRGGEVEGVDTGGNGANCRDRALARSCSAG